MSDDLPLFAEDAARALPLVGAVETWAFGRGLHRLIGADEVGRGPLAGPVVAAAVALPPDHGIVGLDDSKRLSAAARRHLASEIHAHALAHVVVEINAQRIDRTNILRAALDAMAIAVAQIAAHVGHPDLVLVDGNATLPIALPQRAIIGGDGKSEHIAAASIIAKVHRDSLMTRYAEIWPAYGFDHNAGYGTAEHRDALRKVGPCPIHRRTFRGV